MPRKIPISRRDFQGWMHGAQGGGLPQGNERHSFVEVDMEVVEFALEDRELAVIEKVAQKDLQLSIIVVTKKVRSTRFQSFGVGVKDRPERPKFFWSVQGEIGQGKLAL